MEKLNCNDVCKTPPQWKRPEDVMKLHKFKMSRRSIQSHRVLNTPPKSTADSNRNKSSRNKQRFRVTSNNASNNGGIAQLNEIMDEAQSDTLFKVIHFSQDAEAQSERHLQDVTFSNLLDKTTTPPKTSKVISESKSSEELPIDWTLRVKVRLIAGKSFPWRQNLKTCEEAAGITGFVRCIHERCPANTCSDLDTSPNSKFRQCCFVWQHPSVPWLELYPRLGAKSLSNSISLLPLKDAMYKDWIHSFSSLFQLLRSKHCPYFYLISNTFVCLFRCAGIAGHSELNAMITPTTRGFRKLLKDENIEFTMPLSDSNEANSGANSSSFVDAIAAKNVILHNDDTGYDSLDAVNELKDMEDSDFLIDDKSLIEDEQETESWLKSMGVDESEIRKLNNSQLDLDMSKERRVDKKPQSLVYVEGVETQSLFNFLLNCKSLIPTTGQFSGVPPTLLAPVAFVGSTLKSLAVRESMIKMEDKCYHSVEIKGPVLPHTVYSLCDLMKNSSLSKFSLTFANLEASKQFSSVTGHQVKESPVTTPTIDSWQNVQNLPHCGLSSSIIPRLCSYDVKHFDGIKFCDNCFSV